MTISAILSDLISEVKHGLWSAHLSQVSFRFIFHCFFGCHLWQTNESFIHVLKIWTTHHLADWQDVGRKSSRSIVLEATMSCLIDIAVPDMLLLSFQEENLSDTGIELYYHA